MRRPEFASVWYPFLHCRYKLQRDPESGAIQWNSDTNNVRCKPRTLAEICIAYLIRDWPCVLPPQSSSASPSAPCAEPVATLSSAGSAGLVGGDAPSRRPDYKNLPVGLFERLLTEAVVQRDCAAISGLVANWPGTWLNVRRLLPKEDFPLTRGYLTRPAFIASNPDSADLSSIGVLKGPSILDAFIMGLLSRQPCCLLQSVDFSGFEEDLRVSIELSRIPILWMRPEKRNSEEVRQQIRGSLQVPIPDSRFDRYFTRITNIYTLHEGDFRHGQTFDTVTIRLDCNMSVDEVPFGLALQTLTPFRFSCNRLLMQRLPELRLPVFNLIRLLDPMSITQFELEDTELATGAPGVLPSALGWIVSLRNLRACSLPACIAPPRHTASGAAGASLSSHTFASTSPHSPGAACRLLNRALISLRHLQRLGLARCYLGGQLHILLGGLSQPLEYLNIQDCSLTADDIEYLVFNWRPLPCLYELNIARNNLANVPQITMAQLFWRTCFSQTGRLACLSLAYTCMSFDQLTWILKILTREIKPRDIVPVEITTSSLSSDDSDVECVSSNCTLRVLCLQNFVPPTEEVGRVLLHLAVALPRLRFFHLYPAFYAFPGANEKEQQRNRSQEIAQSNSYIRRRGCNHLQIR
ncbi:hypothetical protein SprV_0100170300 [Sparganum proliferum]